MHINGSHVLKNLKNYYNLHMSLYSCVQYRMNSSNPWSEDKQAEIREACKKLRELKKQPIEPVKSVTRSGSIKEMPSNVVFTYGVASNDVAKMSADERLHKLTPDQERYMSPEAKKDFNDTRAKIIEQDNEGR